MDLAMEDKKGLCNPDKQWQILIDKTQVLRRGRGRRRRLGRGDRIVTFYVKLSLLVLACSSSVASSRRMFGNVSVSVSSITK